jgi:indolepyruvate ferredoxin oxidoreductase alpha subunit
MSAQRFVLHAASRKTVHRLGDIGCYTLGAAAPLNAMDMTLCMGASVSSIHGFLKASAGSEAKHTVAVIGDSTFVHSGMTGLANIAYNQSNSTVIILDNSITGMTGHQQNPTTGYNIKGDPAGKIDLEALCRAMGINVCASSIRTISAETRSGCEGRAGRTGAFGHHLQKTVRSAQICEAQSAARGPDRGEVHRLQILHADRMSGDFAIKNGKAHVDETLCVGCGVCEQMCHFGCVRDTGRRTERIWRQKM